MNKHPSFLIIGSAGMAGHMVYTYLREQSFPVYGIDIRKNDFSVDEVVDTTDFVALRRALLVRPYDYVVNCAALLGQPMLEHPDLALRINVEMPHTISKLLVNKKTKLLHISTDFVFSGNRKGGGYTETDTPDNVTLYGIYKRNGEVVASNAMNLRLSVIGPTPKRIIPNFFNNVVASTAGSLWGLTNAYWTGITTLELAKAITELTFNAGFQPFYHLCSSDRESRYDTIVNIMSVFGVNLPIVSKKGEPKDYSLKSTILPYRKPLIEQLIELKQWMLSHPALYGEYACLEK